MLLVHECVSYFRSQALLCVNIALMSKVAVVLSHMFPRRQAARPQRVAVTRRGEAVATELHRWQIHALGRVGPSGQSRQCVLSCFLSCTSLCRGSLVNVRLKGRSCCQNGPPAPNNTAWPPAVLLLQCLTYSSSNPKSSALNRKTLCSDTDTSVKVSRPQCRNVQVQVYHSKRKKVSAYLKYQK